MKRHIPNSITLLNLLAGVVAIIFLADGSIYPAAILIAVGAAFDLLDGMVARILGVSSEIGKQLDSLADMVTFGVAPALIARELMLRSIYMESGDIQLVGWEQVLPFVPLVMVACSALRLAKFNLDVSQALDFKGLPTPANALFWLSIPLSSVHESHVHILGQPIVLAVASMVLGLLMVSDVRLLSMKADRGDRPRSRWQLLFIAVAALLFVWLQFSAVPFIIVLYLLLSLLRNITSRNEIQS